MIYSFERSLDVNLIFDNRPYAMGEIIQVKVELNAKRGVKVRMGRVDLVHEVRWAAPDTVHHPMGRLTRFGPGDRIVNSSALRVPTKKLVEQKHSYVLGSASFLKQTQFESDMDGSYNIGIQIHEDDPPYGFIKGASRGWSLVAVLDVARALDVRMSKEVTVTFDPSEG